KSRSEKYLFIALQSTDQSEWRYAAAGDPELRFKVVLAREPKVKYQVEHLGEDFIIRTNWLAPNYRIVRARIASSTDKSTWKDGVPNRTDPFVESFEVATEYLAVNERSGGLLKLRVKAWNGSKNVLIDSSEPAYTMRLIDTPEIDSRLLRYVYTSLTTPNTTYDYDIRSGQKELKKTDPVLGGFDARNYVTEFL